jgi:hypothetical protein
MVLSIDYSVRRYVKLCIHLGLLPDWPSAVASAAKVADRIFPESDLPLVAIIAALFRLHCFHRIDKTSKNGKIPIAIVWSDLKYCQDLLRR